MGAKVLGLGTLFIFGLMLADALTHPAGTSALGNAATSALSVGGNQLIGIKSTYNSAKG